MSRRQYLENIIIGTLMDSSESRNFFTDCVSCLLPDMFLDDDNRRIYGLVSEMNRKGMTDTNPYNIFMEYGEAVVDLVPRMTELCTDYSFVWLKTEYNERRYIASMRDGVDYGRTDVQFVDYINQFLKLVYEKQ